MKFRAPRDTSSPLVMLIGLLAMALMLLLYSLLGTVEVVFENDEFVIDRQEDVRVISAIEIPDEATEYYVVGAEDVIIDEPSDLRKEIMKTLILNLVTFKWQESDHVIFLHTK